MRRRRESWPPGGVPSLHFLSSGLIGALRNRSVPSRRESLHLGPKYLAMMLPRLYTRRFFGGRQPLCGIGVTSVIDITLKPMPFRARTEDSRPGPGPWICTSRFFTPYSWATVPARSAATWAANGVYLRDLRKPEPPAVAQDMALPLRSVKVLIVLLIDSCSF